MMKIRVETFNSKGFHNLQYSINAWLEKNPQVEYVDVKVISAAACNGEWQHSALLIYRIAE